MNPLLGPLRGCFHHAAQMCSCAPGRLIRGFGLNDFLTNAVQPSDDAPTLAVRALDYFCKGGRAADTRFQIGVLAVTLFLGRHLAQPPRQNISPQVAIDLVRLLEQRWDEQAIRRWIESNFG